MTAIEELLIEVTAGGARAAAIIGGRTVDLQSEPTGDSPQPGEIHLGRVVRVMPALKAAFVEIGAARPALLDLAKGARATEGSAVLVQVAEGPRGDKGARLTRAIGLAGRLLVLRPTIPGIGFSRRLTDPERRRRLGEAVGPLLSGDEGAILRAAAATATTEAMAQELQRLRARWQDIDRQRRAAVPPLHLHGARQPVTRLIDDFVANDPRRIEIDDAVAADIARAHAEQWCPELVTRIATAASHTLFDRYDIADALATAALPVVTLASGARLVVEPTAAATAIDIDSASAAGGSGAPLAVNLEAATEVARQLRLRDLGGIVVVDFLRLPAPRLRDQIVNALRKAVASDRRRVEVLGWTRAGLCELTRMRGRLPATLD